MLLFLLKSNIFDLVLVFLILDGEYFSLFKLFFKLNEFFNVELKSVSIFKVLTFLL